MQHFSEILKFIPQAPRSLPGYIICPSIPEACKGLHTVNSKKPAKLKDTYTELVVFMANSRNR